MTVFLSPVGGAAAQFFDNNGVILSGGKLYTYAAGTTTPAATYTTSSGSTAWTNPIVLDSAGRVPGSGEIWLTSPQSYKFVLKDSNDVQIATYDNVSNNLNGSYTPEDFVGTGSRTVFSLTYAPQSKNSTFVYINGVYQCKNTYSVTNTSLVFSEAPPLTSKIEVLYT